MRIFIAGSTDNDVADLFFFNETFFFCSIYLLDKAFSDRQNHFLILIYSELYVQSLFVLPSTSRLSFFSRSHTHSFISIF